MPVNITHCRARVLVSLGTCNGRICGTTRCCPGDEAAESSETLRHCACDALDHCNQLPRTLSEWYRYPIGAPTFLLGRDGSIRSTIAVRRPACAVHNGSFGLGEASSFPRGVGLCADGSSLRTLRLLWHPF